jgi:DNA repair protein RadD
MFSPRWYQYEAVSAIFDYFEVSDGNPVVAMPTGTGKSAVIGLFTEQALKRYPGTRIMKLTHSKELVFQNTRALLSIWPFAPVGVYSSGLNRKELFMPVTFGNVQSVANVIEEFGHIDLLIIDECHLLSPNENTRYQQVIKTLRSVNPKLKVIGLSATIFRLGQGYITDGGIFTDVCYDLTSVEMFNRLIREGYLAPLIPRPTATTFDLSNVKLVAGEYMQKQLEEAVNIDAVTWRAVQETCELGSEREAWLIFATSIGHAETIAEMLSANGIEAACVHSKLKENERDARIADFKAGKLRAVVNNNILTTGFDHPAIDLISVMRPTMSAALWVQMLGRGTRPYDGKSNCLVLDFARNTPRLGPINDPVIPKKPGEKKGGTAPVKTCPHCGFYNHTRAPRCINCDAEFTFTVGLQTQAGTEEVLRGETPVFEEFRVDRVLYTKHEKDGKLPTLCVSYVSGFKIFKRFLPIEHPAPASNIALKWWKARTSEPMPTTVNDALQYVSTLEKPSSIVCLTSAKYPQVVQEKFERGEHAR